MGVVKPTLVMMNIPISILILLLCAACASGALSTSSNGSLQALASSPRSITLYWRHTGADVQILQDGKPLGSFGPSVTGPFASRTISSLEPNTRYTFTLGEDGPCVSEKTWSELPERAEYDLLIIGGTASGVSAAVTAARLGMSVALVEQTTRLGGMASNGLGSTDIRNISRANGFFEDFRRGVVDFYGEGDGLRYEPRVADAVMKSILYEHDCISLFLKCDVMKPIVRGLNVEGAVVRDLTSNRTGHIGAKMTIDATDTGDFAAACGCRFRVGREARSKDEPHAGIIYFNDERQEILPGSTGEADRKLQSYAYLMIWKDYGDRGAPLIEKPKSYNPDDFRYSADWSDTWNATSGRLPNGKFEINQQPFGIDLPGINYDYATANDQRRREIEAMYKDRALGYLYFMQNDRGHKNLGLADDEFLENDNFPVSLYVREAKRIVGSHIFKENDVTNARQFHRIDSIAVGDYPMDSHAVEELTDPNAEHKGEGEMWLVRFTPWYQTPYWVLIPDGIDGLLVSTAVSATHVGYGALRMEPVRMSLGQAAGAAAYWCVLYGKQPREINPAWIQDKILSQYAYINWDPDIDRDTRHFKAINFLQARGFFPEYGFRPDDPLTVREASDAFTLLLRLESAQSEIQNPKSKTPDNLISRAQFAQMLVETKQQTSRWWRPISPETPSYTDVPQDSPYYAAVETLRAHRIDSGLFEDAEPGLFKPDDPISRADAAEAIFLAHRASAMNCWLPFGNEQ